MPVGIGKARLRENVARLLVGGLVANRVRIGVGGGALAVQGPNVDRMAPLASLPSMASRNVANTSSQAAPFKGWMRSGSKDKASWPMPTASMQRMRAQIPQARLARVTMLGNFEAREGAGSPMKGDSILPL